MTDDDARWALAIFALGWGLVAVLIPEALLRLRDKMGRLRHLDLMEPVYKSRLGTAVMRIQGVLVLLGGLLLLVG